MGYGPALYSSRNYSQIDYAASPYQFALTDSLVESEATTVAIQVPVSDSTSGTDVFGTSFSGSFSDSLASSDAAVVSMTSVLAESISSGESLSASIAKVLAESIASSDGTTIGISIALSEAMNGTVDSLVAAASISLADTALTSEDIANSVAITLQEALSMVDVDTGGFIRFYADAVSVSDTFGLTTGNIALTDFLLIKEFISIRLKRASVWAEGGTVHRGVTPHFYGNVLYAKNMYSTNIAILWGAVRKSTGPGFTNVNGHKYNN